MEQHEVNYAIAAALREVAEKVDRGAKYHRIAVQYNQGNDVDRSAIFVTDVAVRKINNAADEYERQARAARVAE